MESVSELNGEHTLDKLAAGRTGRLTIWRVYKLAG